MRIKNGNSEQKTLNKNSYANILRKKGEVIVMKPKDKEQDSSITKEILTRELNPSIKV